MLKHLSAYHHEGEDIGVCVQSSSLAHINLDVAIIKFLTIYNMVLPAVYNTTAHHKPATPIPTHTTQENKLFEQNYWPNNDGDLYTITRWLWIYSMDAQATTFTLLLLFL